MYVSVQQIEKKNLKTPKEVWNARKMMEKSYGSGFGVGESRKSGEKMKTKKNPDISTALMSVKEREISPDP